MLAVLRDLGLEIYIKEDAPKSADERRRTDEETKTITEWEAKDAKARTRIRVSDWRFRNDTHQWCHDCQTNVGSISNGQGVQR